MTHHRNSPDHISLFTFSRHDAETSEFTVTLQVCQITQRNTPKLISTQDQTMEQHWRKQWDIFQQASKIKKIYNSSIYINE